MPIAPEMLQQAYLEACEAELQAFKPGNVSIHSEGHGMTVADFRLSAKASAPHLCDPALSLGEKIFQAIASTREAVGCNTNLGIVLLAAPMMESCLTRAKVLHYAKNCGMCWTTPQGKMPTGFIKPSASRRLEAWVNLRKKMSVRHPQ